VLGIHAYVVTCAGNRKAQQKRKTLAATEALKRICCAVRPADARRMTRSTETGAWLTATPNLLNGTELSADEFRDNIRMHLGLTPTSLPQQCAGCDDPFTIAHAMSCKKGGLVSLCHNDLKAEWHHLCSQALTPSAISDEPLIRTSQDVQQAGAEGVAPQQNSVAMLPPMASGHAGTLQSLTSM